MGGVGGAGGGEINLLFIYAIRLSRDRLGMKLRGRKSFAITSSGIIHNSSIEPGTTITVRVCYLLAGDQLIDRIRADT